MDANPHRRSQKHLQKLRIQAGSWLRELREKRGLSQRDLAERVGAACYTLIAQLESGRGRIPSQCYQAWADALGITPQEFVRTLNAFYDPASQDIVFADPARVQPVLVRARRSSIRLQRSESRRRTPTTKP